MIEKIIPPLYCRNTTAVGSVIPGRERVNVAIVHDYLNQRGGAERVVAVLHEMFPDAPIFTSIVDWDNLLPELTSAEIHPSWMQKLPGLKKHFKKYLPFYPSAIESHDLREYDLVLSSSSSFAKGAIKGRDALHICYCYTPMRFTWDYENYVKREKMNRFARGILPLVIAQLKRWDLKTRFRPDYYIAISTAVRDRIRRIYGFDAEVIFPPVEVNQYQPTPHWDNFYLIVSRLNSYKRIDLAVETFNRLGLPLKIIGSGPFLNPLKCMAKSNVTFLGRIDDQELREYYAHCKALIFPGEEDFGIAPVEANAAGRPVIALKKGGAVDTIIQGVNGLFFEESSVESLTQAIQTLEGGKYPFDPQVIREQALRFDKEIFKGKMKRFIAEKHARFRESFQAQWAVSTAPG